MFGLLPNNALNVIGVGWTLGVIFLFYLLFPVFVIATKTKRRAWILLAVSIWISFVCEKRYFTDIFVTELFTPRHCFLYCLPVFTIGALFYLYRNNLCEVSKIWKYVLLFFCVVSTVIYYVLPNKGILFYKNMFMYSIWFSFVLVDRNNFFLSNKLMKFLGDISFEIYLSHMFIFRFFERTGIISMFKGQLGYWFISIGVIIGTICFVVVYRFCFQKLVLILNKNKMTTIEK